MKPITPTNRPPCPVRPTGKLIRPKKRKNSLPRPWSPVTFPKPVTFRQFVAGFR